jgi:hypothetical protein
VREFRLRGSVRGALSNERPYGNRATMHRREFITLLGTSAAAWPAGVTLVTLAIILYQTPITCRADRAKEGTRSSIEPLRRSNLKGWS